MLPGRSEFCEKRPREGDSRYVESVQVIDRSDGLAGMSTLQISGHVQCPSEKFWTEIEKVIEAD